ncbi:MAG: Nif3-like dinuclear metal center hexameric protein [Planctomycetota bacterium]
MKLDEVLRVLRSVAPERLAEPWDKVGRQLGSPTQRVSGAMLCIDLTETVVAEAVKKKCELIVSYHPPIFRPLEGLRDDGPWTQRRILAAARAGLAVYSPHTALDAVRGGVCDWLCGRIGPGSSAPIRPASAERDAFKVVVFVPEADEAAVRSAMAAAGAGGIGNYRECSFSIPGAGGFRPVEGANPAIGEVGKREEVAERRLEMLVPGPRLAEVLGELRRAHSYEEPAFDVLRLEPEPAAAEQAAGAGRVLTLDRGVTPDALATSFDGLPEAAVKLGHRGVKRVRTVAVCPGAGGSLFEEVEASGGGGVDAYVTGEMQHHQALDLVQRGRVVVLLGHTASERPYLPVYRDRLRRAEGGSVKWSVSRADRAPLVWRGRG